MSTQAPQQAVSDGYDGRSDGPGTAGGDIERVNAFDGLFLRSEHLNRMQDYARDLAYAVGAAGGPGVVEGYVVARDGQSLTASPGLAIDPRGRPLLTRTIARLDITPLAATGDEFFWVEITGEDWDFGSEAVQGVLCDEPCSGGTTARPYTAEGVRLRLTPGLEIGLGGVDGPARRSWLASRLFADEAVAADAWPDDATAFAHRDWGPPAADSAKATAVRLAVLIPDADTGWQLDTWVARRDRGAPPPLRAWQWRLGMRPWDVFVAQVLQFQALLADRWTGGEPGGARFLAEVLRRLGEVAGRVEDVTKKQTSAWLSELRQDLQEGSVPAPGKPRPEAAITTLPALGIGELPPAGFLPRIGGEAVATATTALLGGPDVVDVRVCHGGPGDVGAWLQAAQHRARIPLDGVRLQPVDLLVVDSGRREGPDWVAFARRDTTVCTAGESSPDTDPVDVYLVEPDDREERAAWQAFWERGGKIPDLPGEPVATLHYPVRTWAVPEDPELERITDVVRKWQQSGVVDAVALVTSEERRPLGAVRAELLAGRFGETRPRLADLRVHVTDRPEAVVLVLGPEPEIRRVTAKRTTTRRTTDES